jgi:PAS domain S-box-containing protein
MVMAQSKGPGPAAGRDPYTMSVGRKDGFVFRHGGSIAVAGLAILLAATIAAALAVLNMDDIVEVSSRVQRVRTEATRLSAELATIEAAEYAVLVDPRPDAVEHFRTEAAEFPDSLRKVDSLIQSPNNRSRFQRVAAAASARVAEARRRVDMAAGGQLEAARADLGAGEAPRKEFLDSLDQFLAANSVMLRDTGHQYSHTLRRLMGVILASALAMLFFGIHQVLSTYRLLREIDDSRRSLDSANRFLEAEVRSRTDELARINQLFATAIAGSRVTLFAQDSRLVYTWIHNAPRHLSERDIIGQSDEAVTPSEWRDSVIAAKKRVLATGRTEVFDLSLPAPDGSRLWYRMQVDPLYEHGERTGIVCAAVDISEDRAARRTMRELADKLAGTVQRFEIALRGAEVFVFTQDRERRYSFVSHGHGGREPAAFLGLRDEDVLPRSDGLERVIAAKDHVLATGEVATLSVQITTDGGEQTWLKLRIEPLTDPTGRVMGLIGTAQDITAEKANQDRLARVSVALQTALQRFEVTLRGAEIIVFSQDRDLRHTWASATLGEVSAQDVVGRTDEEIFPPETARRLIEFKSGILESGEAQRGEFRIVDADGEERWLHLRVEPQRNDQGEIVGLLGAGVDVTERRQRETHIRILLRELTHRTKNMLAVIQAMARQTLTASVSAKDFEQRFSGRLQGLASSLDILVDENWRGASIGELIRSQLGPYRDMVGSRILLSGDDFSLEPEAAQNIGLALHELGTNSAKYGALSVPTGVVEISWKHQEDGQNFLFRWRERGGPPVEPPQHKGFGHAVIERLVPRALNGRARLDYPREGFSWELEIPAGLLRQEPAAEPFAAQLR